MFCHADLLLFAEPVLLTTDASSEADLKVGTTTAIDSRSDSKADLKIGGATAIGNRSDA